MGWMITLVLLGLAGFWIAAVYNSLVAKRNQAKNGFAQIDVQLKRRHDLIPNLIETVKGYMKHESSTLEAVMKARSGAQAAAQIARAGAGGAADMAALAAAEGALSSSLGRLFAVSEAYPNLKANENMLSLQEELSSTENKIAFSRQAYNDSVMSYNTARESFPAVLAAGALGFASMGQLEAIEAPEERKAPSVKF